MGSQSILDLIFLLCYTCYMKGNPGIPKSEEHKRKLSVAMKGKPGYWTGKKMPEYARAAMRIPKGPMSPEQKQKISNTLKELFKNPIERERLKTWTGRHHTQEYREKMSLANKGENGRNWKGGISPVNEIIRQSSEFKQWRVAVFAKDNYTCQQCGAKHEVGNRPQLHPHHKKPFAEYPELRFVVENGITLCAECHRKIHKKEQ